jgi:asparagine synthetase B (glutamine-hydrolysing)
MSQTPLRDLFKEILSPLPSRIAIATSGGIDSSALVASAVEANKSPVIFSFTFHGHESADFLGAKKLAAFYNAPFAPVYLPTDQAVILDAIRLLTKTYRLKKKARIECAFPFLYLADSVKTYNLSTLVTGLCADGHFGLSKKAMIHHREPQSNFDSFRVNYFSDPDAGGRRGIAQICKQANIEIINPYLDTRVFRLFIGRSWDDLNKPRQKEAIRQEYPELDRFNIPRHSNLQLGDSGIAERLGAAATAAIPGTRSAIAAYNRIRCQ